MKDEIGSAMALVTSFDKAKALMDDWMDYYNNDRGQWSLAKLSPNEFYIQAVSELLHGAKAQFLYLPAYSPDLNPIEKLWSKVRTCIHKRLSKVWK